MVSESRHITVLLSEAVNAVSAGKGGVFLDCTFGGGGHTQAMLQANDDNRVYAIDRDLRALERGRERLAVYGSRLSLEHLRFSDLQDRFGDLRFDGVLADLGTSMDQLKDGRGFSFSDHAQLDMRMDESVGVTAAELINSASEQDLFIILRKGGVGPEARQIARAIVRERPVMYSDELAKIVSDELRGRYREKKGNPATVVFQAIRMAVNQELEEIEALLNFVPTVSSPGARFAVITFHSLEDKLVASRMRSWASEGEFSAVNPQSRPKRRLGRYLSRESVQPSESEVQRNPSARSSRLRVFEFLGESEV